MPSYKYIVDFIANTRKFNGDVEKAGVSVKRVMGGIAASVGVGLSVATVIDFTAELVNLSEKGQWVERAFARIADGKFLDELQRATLNEVDNLELMQRAIQADNFKIPLNELATLFKFASIRAKETGENVDFLVQSIITGIGRKSPLILDNLGISAIELRKRLGGISAEAADIGTVTKIVGQIAQEELKKMGEAANDTSLSIQQIKTDFDNWKLALSQDDDFTKYVQGSLNELKQVATIAFSDSLSGWQKFTAVAFGSREKWLELASVIEVSKNMAKQAAEQFAAATQYDDNEYRNKIAAEQDLITSAAKQITTYADLKEQIKDKNALLDAADITDRAYIKTLYAEIEALEKKKKAFEALAEPLTPRIAAPEKMVGLRGGENVGVSLGKEELKAFDEQNKRLDDMAERNNRVAESVQAMNDGWQSYIEKMWMVAEAHDYLNGGLTQLEMAGLSFAENMMQAATSADVTLENLGQTVKSVVADTIRAYIAEGVAGAVSKSLSFLPFPFNMAAGAAAAVGATALFNSVIPAFADGGIIKGPTVGLMGEYPGASRNPEVVGKLSDLEKMLPRGSNDTQVFIPAVKLKDDHILISFNRAQKRQYYRT